MNLKYKTFIAAFNDCVVKTCIPNKRVAFRWVFENIKDKRNFTPRYLLPAYVSKEKLSCVGYALSMFDTPEQATTRFKEITKDKPNIYKKFGTHLSEGIVQPDEGICTSSIAGHFSCFEFENTDFSNTFKIKASLIAE